MSEPTNIELPVNKQNFAKTLHLKSEAYKDSLKDKLQKLATDKALDQEKIELLESQSILDPQTRLYNKPYFLEQAHRMHADASRGESSYAMLIMDIDGFKKYANDKYGHAIGDGVIDVLKNIISNDSSKEQADMIFRKSDYIARLGGDEFGVLMPSVDPDDDLDKLSINIETRLVSKFREQLHTQLPKCDELKNLDISIGIYSPQNGDTVDNVYAMADKNMYARKQSKQSLGSNR